MSYLIDGPEVDDAIGVVNRVRVRKRGSHTEEEDTCHMR
jgi:hypothetical protein